MIKVTFKEPIKLQDKSEEYGYGDPFECRFVLTSYIYKYEVNFIKCIYFHGYFGLAFNDNIKSIEHVKPTEL